MGRELLNRWTRKDFEITWFRGTGGGGQHRNKHPNCVRIKHIESGLMTTGQAERSRSQNFSAAFQKMGQMLLDHYHGRAAKARNAAGNRVIRTYHEADDRVVDHDTGARYSYRQTVGKGRLHEVIEDRALEMAAQEATDALVGPAR